jgi:serine protease
MTKIPDEPLVRDDDGIELNGYVVIALAGSAPVEIESDELTVFAEKLKLAELVAVLGRVGSPPTEPVIRGGQRADVARLESLAAERYPQRRRLSLLAYWRIDARRTAPSPNVLVSILRHVRGVAVAYAAGAVSTPSAGAEPEAAAAANLPSYLTDGPEGVGLECAAAYPGGDGSLVGLVDVEEGWRLSHPALQAAAVHELPDPDNRRGNHDGIGSFVGDHGTAVLAIVVGADPPNNMVGMANGLSFVRVSSHYDAVRKEPLHVAAAISAAATALVDNGPGGVLLVEVQRGNALTALPTETESADFTAILTATHAGVVVVEAAGNSNLTGYDLDTWQVKHDPFYLRRDDVDHDSLAIMVGACSVQQVDGGHARWDGSNYGERVDCHAVGENLYTALATGYQKDFGGTSSASAVIAGAAVVAQSIQLAAHGAQQPLAPKKMRALLSGPGTPQVGDLTKPIGPMPDLCRIAGAIAGPPPA